MPGETPILKLKKPALNETADIEVINTNWDVLDAEVGGHKSAAAPHTGHETPAGAQAKVNAHALDNTVHGMQVHTGNFVATAGIVQGGVHTHAVPLGASDFKRVAARFFHVVNRLGAFVYAGRTVASAVSMIVANGWQICKSRAVHSELGENSVMFINSCISGANGITLEHVYINGSNLEIRWRNVDSVVNSLNIRVEWEVYK